MVSLQFSASGLPEALLLAVGAVTCASLLFSAVRVLLSVFVLPGKPLSKMAPRGTYALITGASDGIGLEFALQLAAKGYNLVLVSRTASKLQALSEQIKSKSPSTDVKIYAMDFGANKATDYSNIASMISSLDVSILINNVGQSHSIPVMFAETSEEEMNNIITINCTGTLKITQLVLPRMLSKHRGLILTMGSFGGLTPTPLLATYSGSKAFLQQWSNALASEVAPAGITVHFIHSYLVTSAMSKIKHTNWQVPTARTFVRSALSKIGRRGGSIGYAYSGSPYFSHAIALSVILGVVGQYGKPLLDYNRKMHLAIRKRALKKQQLKLEQSKKAA